MRCVVYRWIERGTKDGNKGEYYDDTPCSYCATVLTNQTLKQTETFMFNGLQNITAVAINRHSLVSIGV